MIKAIFQIIFKSTQILRLNSEKKELILLTASLYVGEKKGVKKKSQRNLRAYSTQNL